MKCWLLVTPARDEERHLPTLARTLADQVSPDLLHWVVVDDGSTDQTATCVDWDELPFPVEVVARPRGGGLAVGGAFAAFFHGAEHGIKAWPGITHVMKLDADVALSATFFAHINAAVCDGIVGGVVPSGGPDREQLDHVPGFVKGYSMQMYKLVSELPAAIGLDVIDEALAMSLSLPVVPVPAAHVTLQRSIGDSEGTLKGRGRNGRVSRWCGYYPPYFVLRLVRYLPRRPRVVGAVVMLASYIRAGHGPFPAHLRVIYRDWQRRKLLRLVRNPFGSLRSLYVVSATCGDPKCVCIASAP